MATDLARIGVEMGWLDGDESTLKMKMGRVLGKEFPREDAYEFAQEFRVVRHDVIGVETNYEKMKTYSITPLAKTYVTRQA